ncbi:MAG: hypothetical protein RLY47_322 [Candidatus Parcubacteria bacterium]|jgi:hypothetical protein
MKKLLSFLTFSFLILALVLPSLVFATDTWLEVTPTGFAANYGWSAAASDADGSNLFVGASGGGGRLWTSSNGGITWTQRQPIGNFDGSWRALDSDDDGSNLIVGGQNSRLYTSDDGGVSWTERQPAGDVTKSWWDAASDADGSNLIAGIATNGRLYTSSNGGVDWIERQPAGDVNGEWRSVDSDADGSNLIAGVLGGRLYTSSNGGVDWIERQPAGDVDTLWWGVASDADGSNLIASVSNGRLYTSSNGGVDWTERQPAGAVNKSWITVASDSDGSHLIAAVSSGRLYTSDDSGENWTEQQPAGATDKGWNAVALDADGSFMIANVNNGRVYMYPDIPNITTFDPADGAIEIGLDATFSITFEQDIATSTGDIVLYDASDDSVVETIDIAGGLVSLSGTDTLVIDPSVTLELGTEYYFLIDIGAVEDLVGNGFVGISDETTWNFTSDAVPTSVGFTPGDDETGVAIDISQFDLYFSETVVAGTGNITLFKTSDDSVVETFDVTDGDAVTVDSTLVSLFPTVTLENETDYYFHIDATAIEDESGNLFAGIADETTWNFIAAPAITFDFERVSISDGAEEGDGTSQNPKISSDGRYVVFESVATNLVPDDTNGTYDIFVYDRQANSVKRVSLNGEGGENVENAGEPEISGDGRFVLFSTSGLLLPENMVGVSNVFVYDRDTEELTFVSKNEGGEEGDSDSARSALSEDGRYIVFTSQATNLVVGDTNGKTDIFVYDQTMEAITREVAFDTEDQYFLNANEDELILSNDGRYIVYVRFDNDTSLTNVFLFDRESDTTEQVDVDSDEVTGDASATTPAISEDGRYVVFWSDSTNLTADEVNGSGAVFLRDRTLGTTELIGDDYVTGNGYVSGRVAVSSDGRYVFYTAYDEGGEDLHLYRYDREEDVELLITEGVGIADGGASVSYPDVSDGGTVVSFYSSNTNLVIGDTNGVADVFVWEEINEEETPPAEDEEDDGGSSGSHRRSGGGGSGETMPPATGTPLEQLQLKLIELLKQLLQELIKTQAGTL